MAPAPLEFKRLSHGADVFSGNRLIGTIYSDESDTYYWDVVSYYYRNYELGEIKAYCDKLILKEV